MDYAILQLRRTIQRRAAARRASTPLLGAALTIGTAVAFYGALFALLFNH